VGGAALWWLAIEGGCLPEQQADGLERAGTTGMETAAMPDWHNARGPDMLEASAAQRDGVERGRPGAGTAPWTGGERNRAVLEAHDAAVGEGDPEARGGKGGEGGMAVVVGLTVDVPGAGPDRRLALLQQPSVAPVCPQERPGDGGEGLHGDTAGGSGGVPGWAVLRQSTARDDGVPVGGGLELPAPGVQDTGETREVGADATRVLGEACAGCRRSVDQGVGREALRRAEAGAACRRDGAGEEAVRPGPRVCQVVLEPLRGCLRLALGTVAVATGMLDAVWGATTCARREAMAVMAAAAVWDGAADLTVRGGEVGRALQGCWRPGGAEVAAGRHGRSPCSRALRR